MIKQIGCFTWPRSPFFFIACVFFSVVLASCKNNLADAKMIVARANVNIEKGKEVEINYSDNGMVRIKAIAPTATRFNTGTPYLEFSNGIKIQFYNAQHKVESTVTAKYATAYENSNSMTARDSRRFGPTRRCKRMYAAQPSATASATRSRPSAATA